MGEFARRIDEIHADSAGGKQEGQRVRRQMAARRAEPVTQPLAHNIGRHDGAVGGQLDIDQLSIRAPGLAKRQEDAGARLACHGVETAVLRRVARNDREAARFQPLKDFRLGVGDGFQTAKVFKMHRRDGSDHCHMRAHHLHERADFIGMVHADFKDADSGVHRHARKRERHAPMVIVGRRRNMRFAEGAEHTAHGFLGACLADRTGDGHHHARHALARCLAKPLHRREHVMNDKERAETLHRIDIGLVDHRCRRARLKGVAHKGMAVMRLAADREIEIVDAQGARVDGHAIAHARQGAENARLQWRDQFETRPQLAGHHLAVHAENSCSAARTAS